MTLPSPIPAPTLAPRRRAARAARSTRAAGFIVGPIYDLSLFILSPLFALAFGWIVSRDEALHHEVEGTILGRWYDGTPLNILMGIVIMAHIGAVFLRSHGNTEVRRAHPWRFWLVPPLLFGAMLSSTWIFVSVAVLAVWWDVYHSGAQTFGLARIYDSKAGNDATQGRWLDFWLNQVIYAGPVLAGANLMAHVNDFEEFEAVGSTLLTGIPAVVEGFTSWLTWGVVAISTGFLAWYMRGYARLRREGYRVSVQKTVLLVTTAAVSVAAWGFNTFGEAFVIMNLFHAVQYFGIVWATEKGSLTRLLRLERVPLGRVVALGLFLAGCTAYGFATELMRTETWVTLFLTASILHFWYDGFIWSVRRRQV